MNYAPTPKAEFLKEAKNIEAHHVVVENPAVRKGLEIALAEMQHQAANGTDPANFNACAAAHLRMLGAKDFLSIFYNLAETFTPATKSDTTNLPSNVRQMPPANKKN
jgi:hypothetical protein